MIGDLIKYINETHNFELKESDYHSFIARFKLWYQGHVPEVHDYRFNNRKVVMASLGMAKKIGEDYASLVINEETKIKCDDKKVEEYLVGSRLDQAGGVLSNNNFFKEMTSMCEKMYGYAGSSAIVVGVADSNMTEDGTLSGGDVNLRYITSENIIPLSWKSEHITEVAFFSERAYKGKRYILLEVHLIDKEHADGGYVVHNTSFVIGDNGRISENKELINAENIVELVQTDFPLFHIWNGNTVNNLVENYPLSLPAIANAIPQLTLCDSAFNNLQLDLRMGGKKLFIQQDYIQTTVDIDGKKKPLNPAFNEGPFMVMSDTMEQKGEAGKPIIEYNPLLRVDENEQAINKSLELLSDKVGLGKKWYSFNAESMATATQVRASNRDLTYSVSKQRTPLVKFISDVCKTIVKVSNSILTTQMKEDIQITAIFDDSLLRDPEMEKTQDMQLVSQGIMKDYEYRVKWLGDDMKTALDTLGYIYQEVTEGDEVRFTDIQKRPLENVGINSFFGA